MNTKEKGHSSEEKAALWLRDRGWEILERNYRLPFGEIDIIGIKDGILTAFEVKTLPASWDENSISEMVDRRKLIRIKRTMAAFLDSRTDLSYNRIRFDVISVEKDGNILHYEGV